MYIHIRTKANVSLGLCHCDFFPCCLKPLPGLSPVITQVWSGGFSFCRVGFFFVSLLTFQWYDINFEGISQKFPPTAMKWQELASLAAKGFLMKTRVIWNFPDKNDLWISSAVLNTCLKGTVGVTNGWLDYYLLLHSRDTLFTPLLRSKQSLRILRVGTVFFLEAGKLLQSLDSFFNVILCVFFYPIPFRIPYQGFRFWCAQVFVWLHSPQG